MFVLSSGVCAALLHHRPARLGRVGDGAGHRVHRLGAGPRAALAAGGRAVPGPRRHAAGAADGALLAGPLRDPRVRQERLSVRGPWRRAATRCRSRPLAPAHWRVTPTGDAVHVRYRLFADHVDGTYSSVDGTHAHLNAPATFVWAPALMETPIRVRFTQPPGRTWRVSTQLFPTDDRARVHGAEPAVLHGLARRVQRPRRARVHRVAAGRRHAGADQARGPSPRHRRAGRRLRRDGGEDRPRAGGGLRRARAVRRRHVHVPDGLPALGRRRRHGTPQQHGVHVVGESRRRHVARGQHGVARVLPLLERRTHPPGHPRAVRLLEGQHVRRAVVGRRVHPVLRRARDDSCRADLAGSGCRRRWRCSRPASCARLARSSGRPST